MKKQLVDGLLSPNLWVAVFSVLAVAGIVCLSCGQKTIGLWLLAPLVISGIIVIVVVIPILIRANRKHKRTESVS